MLSRGDAVVYKCRGVYKVEEVGKLDFSFVDGKKDYYTLQSIDNQRDKAYVLFIYTVVVHNVLPFL